MKINYSKEAVKHIERLDSSTKHRIRTAIEKLPNGDTKKLKGYTHDYRLRVGDYRVLYALEDDAITIKEVLSRGQVYKRL